MGTPSQCGTVSEEARGNGNKNTGEGVNLLTGKKMKEDENQDKRWVEQEV